MLSTMTASTIATNATRFQRNVGGRVTYDALRIRATRLSSLAREGSLVTSP